MLEVPFPKGAYEEAPVELKSPVPVPGAVWRDGSTATDVPRLGSVTNETEDAGEEVFLPVLLETMLVTVVNFTVDEDRSILVDAGGSKP